MVDPTFSHLATLPLRKSVKCVRLVMYSVQRATPAHPSLQSIETLMTCLANICTSWNFCIVNEVEDWRKTMEGAVVKAWVGTYRD